MSPGQHAGAEGCVARETVRVELLDGNRGFHVPQLADIEITSPELRPPKERVTGGLHDALAGDHPLPIVRKRTLLEMWLEHGGWRLLELEEERIVRAGGLQEENIGAKPDTANPD